MLKPGTIYKLFKLKSILTDISSKPQETHLSNCLIWNNKLYPLDHDQLKPIVASLGESGLLEEALSSLVGG